jgi:hypothetical protein
VSEQEHFQWFPCYYLWSYRSGDLTNTDELDRQRFVQNWIEFLKPGETHSEQHLEPPEEEAEA